MGFSITSTPSTSMTRSHYHTHKLFLYTNYILLGAASSCIFLTLSLRLLPSLCGLSLIFLHILTIAAAVSGCAMAAASSTRWFGVHMVFTVLTAIFQGSVAMLVYTRTGDFLSELKSYVREEDGAVILKLAGGLSVVMFVLEWVVLTLAFFLRYYAFVEEGSNNNGAAMRSAKVQQDEDLKDWPWPFQLKILGVFSVETPHNYSIMQSNEASTSMDVETISTQTKDVVSTLPPKPQFDPLKPHEMNDGRVQFRKVSVPPHRYSPLKKAWMDIYTPIYDQMKIDIRMNLKARKVELKTRADTPDISNLQKSADFVHAFMLGFDVIDAIALLRVDELYVESFEIKDVKTLRGEHLSRAIGRLSGKAGKTKFAIENATKTRIVIADTKIHILGSFANIKIARDSLCSLILGSPAGKVYSKLRAVTARLAERF
ncbi:hypothetical protein Csa_010636 [Cucumis sativus]|nr:hypothetical protein Csa_010636 [Cucumis sativus]